MSFRGVFFNSWGDLARTVLVGTLGYIVLIAFLCVSGKRTLSKMNAFDFIVTVALGSTLASITLSKDVALAEGATAFLTLIGLQFVITWLSVRWEAVAGFVKAEPTLLLHNGQYLRAAMKQQRVLEAEIRAAIRAQGIASVEQVADVVLETDGSFNVIGKSDTDASSSALGSLLPDGDETEKG